MYNKFFYSIIIVWNVWIIMVYHNNNKSQYFCIYWVKKLLKYTNKRTVFPVPGTIISNIPKSPPESIYFWELHTLWQRAQEGYARVGLFLQKVLQFAWFYIFKLKPIQTNSEFWPLMPSAAYTHWSYAFSNLFSSDL